MSALDALAGRTHSARQRLAGRRLSELPVLGRTPRPEPAAAPASRPGVAAPLLVLGAALVLGVAAARWIDWRGHAHPRG